MGKCGLLLFVCFVSYLLFVCLGELTYVNAEEYENYIMFK